MIKFFKDEEEQRIIAAIQEAEKNTSGEIRVHLEQKPDKDIMKNAVKVFKKLKMHKTAARNGVLFFIAPEAKAFAILGDEGINKVVPENFWETEKDILQGHFKTGAFTDGICLAIQQVGRKLKEFFPYQDDDINELPDNISYGDDK